MDPKWMQLALAQAQKALANGEVPVGAVLVLEGVVIGQGYNQSIASDDPTAHAEIVALRQAALHLKNYRLPQADLYVTLEPCLMCAGAMVHARIGRLFFAASDPKTGVAGSVANAFQFPHLNHRIETMGGLMAEEAKFVLQQFFKKRRETKRLSSP